MLHLETIMYLKYIHIIMQTQTTSLVHKADGISCAFTPSKMRRFYSDVKGNTAHVLINTLNKNKSKYTVKQYSDSNKAWLIQNIIGHPITDDYIKYVQSDLIPNCPITKADILHAEDILGPNLGSLKVKTTRKSPEKVTINSCDESPDSLLEGMAMSHWQLISCTLISYLS